MRVDTLGLFYGRKADMNQMNDILSSRRVDGRKADLNQINDILASRRVDV